MSSISTSPCSGSRAVLTIARRSLCNSIQAVSCRRRGLTRDQFALNLDVAPTLIAAAGFPIPRVMQGRDLSPLYLETRPPAWRDDFFYEHPAVTSNDRIPSSRAVMRKDWKYIEWPEFDYPQPFNLKADPGKLRNLAGDRAHAAQKKMRAGARGVAPARPLKPPPAHCGTRHHPSMAARSAVTRSGRSAARFFSFRGSSSTL